MVMHINIRNEDDFYSGNPEKVEQVENWTMKTNFTNTLASLLDRACVPVKGSTVNLAEAAKQMNIDPKRLGEYANGKSLPTFENIRKMARFFQEKIKDFEVCELLLIDGDIIVDQEEQVIPLDWHEKAIGFIHELYNFFDYKLLNEFFKNPKSYIREFRRFRTKAPAYIKNDKRRLRDDAELVRNGQSKYEPIPINDY